MIFGFLALPPPPPLELLLLLAGWAVAQLVTTPTANAMPPTKPTFLNSRAGTLKFSTFSQVEIFGIVFMFYFPFLAFRTHVTEFAAGTNRFIREAVTKDDCDGFGSDRLCQYSLPLDCKLMGQAFTDKT
jgi:hypothetical protein